MYCYKCGTEIADRSKFCSICGAKIEHPVDPAPVADAFTETVPFIDNTLSSASSRDNKPMRSHRNQRKGNTASHKGKFSLFGIIAKLLIAFYTFLCLGTLMTGLIGSAIVTIFAIAILILALLIKKQTIKTKKKGLHVVALILAIFLFIPFSVVLTTENKAAKTLIWSDMMLSDVVPPPASLMGDTISNTESSLSVDIQNTSSDDYANYIETCKHNGFTVDVNESDSAFSAYNDSGYAISLSFTQSESKMHITVDAAKEYGTFVWPKSELANLIPMPTSTTGEISKDDNTGFSAIVSNTSIDDYKLYIASCGDMGFNIDTQSTDKSYSAKNSDNYKVNVEYKGNNIISICADFPICEVTVKITFIENIAFSKYDVDLLIDNTKEGTLKHGIDAELKVGLTAGEHTINFAKVGSTSVYESTVFNVSENMELSYAISCSKSKITVEDLIAKQLEQQRIQAAEAEQQAVEAEAAKKAEELMNALEQLLPKEMAKRASIVAITNYCNAVDVYKRDGNTLDVSKFHSYADTTGNFFDYYIGVLDWGNWTATDAETWHATQLRYINCFGTAKRASLDVRYDGENYLVSNVITDVEGQSESITPVSSEAFIVAPKLIKDDRAQTRLDKYSAWVLNQFSPWDGSHEVLKALIKKNLNDEKSFEHITTTYQIINSEDSKTKLNKSLKSAGKSDRVEIGDLYISTEFSAKNAFGATVKHIGIGIVSFAKDTATLIAIE